MNSRPPKLDRLMMIFTVIDILFLPYVFFITITYSFVFVIWWFFKRKEAIIATNNDYKQFVWMTVLMLFSSLFGILLNPASASSNMTFWLQYTVTFLHLYLFKYYLDRYSFNLKPYLIGFVLFVVLTAVAFNFNRGVYDAIRNIWAPRASAGLLAAGLDTDSIGRFGFIWMDENNIGYMLNCIVVFLLCNERTTMAEKLTVIVCDLFVLVSCMSNGGLYTFIMGMGLVLVFKMFETRKKRKKKMNLAGLLICIVLGVFVIQYAPKYLQGEVAQASMERIEDNSADSRKRVYKYILENTNFVEYALIGHGQETLVKGQKVKPHNIHLYYVLAYGIIAWLLMLYIVFRKRKQTRLIEYIWIVPFFMGASANIIIGEQKAMCIAMLLLAASISPKYLLERR